MVDKRQNLPSENSSAANDTATPSLSTEKTIKRRVKRELYGPHYHALLRIGIFLILAGALIFIHGILVVAGLAFWIGPWSQLPLGTIDSIAVDSKGTIYLALDYYYRMQCYSPEGKFLRSWPYNDNNPRFRVNDLDQLEMANDNDRKGPRNYPDTLTIFDSDGKILSYQVVPDCHAKFGPECEHNCRDRAGNLYTVHNVRFRPYVTKTTVDGRETILIRDSFFYWLFAVPVPGWIFSISGAALVFFVVKFGFREIKHESAEIT